VDALKKLSRKGANVIVVLHQPSWQIFEKFDNVILLAPGGSSAFVGPASDAMAFFESIGFSCPPLVNPADVKPLFPFPSLGFVFPREIA